MNYKTAYSQPLAGCIATLIVGSVGVTAASPVMAQPFPKKLPFQTAQSSSLIIGNWRLSNMTESSAPTPMVPSTDLTADFAGDRVTGTGGCNRFNGGFQTRGNQLKIGPLATTFKACEEPLMTQESRYLKALQGAQRYEVANPGQLTIFYRTDRESGTLRYLSQNTNPGNPTPPAVQGTFQGRGVAQGSAFTRGRTATTVLTIDRDNFGFELTEPGGRTDAPRARVQYRGAVIRRTNGSVPNSFTLDGRVRSYTSSANLRVLNNTTGTCRIEVFDARVISSSCRAATAESSTQFLGLEQF
ncbi:hypothetical protein C7B65_14890 [Phormidesmis priestleyi ULC007]|uniref:DUF306 domain-containing protein n=1 Tax=Phormidesmis priestleyi ULC007 TaxID=1920490 RepID=A0A2T1DDL8_9CYAN|nr:META domain-containing protein [Phormidesmis priestleyi]PSB18579.1 hypothetical protein C7B65_14890 [Phormidesmis priestleyi ULC007]PZO49772.1 MAG: META domain-containing protein [Phormidesmis priestleyi]